MEGDPFTLQLVEVHKGRPIKLQVKVLVPVHDHPNFNFVGKLLGPKGNSLKRLQEATQTRMAILGKGSMRNKEKEEELRKLRDPKHSHLNQELHVDISTFAPASEAYARIAHALSEVKRFLVPDYYDDIRQHQLRELAILNCDKKQGQGPEVGNGAESASPLSSPTSTTPPPPEPLRILPPSLPSSQLHSPHTAAVVRLSSSSSPGGKGRLTRIPYPPYRHVPSVVNTPYRRVPIYGSMDSDPPALIIPDHPDSAYDDGFPEDFYDPLYDNDFPLLGDGKDSEFPGPVAAVPPDRSYEHNFYQSWTPTPSNIRRLKAFTLRTLPRTAYRNKPYPLPPCH